MAWWHAVADWYADYQLKRLTLQMEAQTAPYRAMERTVDALVKSNQATTAVLQQWIEGFQTTSVASTSTLRDTDEVRLELERLGFERPELHESLDSAIKAGEFEEFKHLIQGIDA
jgi:type II secretory pathway component GspD/PulD (secretin)